MRAVDPPTVVLEAPPQELDPRSKDVTVELTRAFLEEHSSDLLALVDGTDEAFRPVDAMEEVFSAFEDKIPTAKVRYLGEDDAYSYDLEDLVDPPTPEAIENLLLHGSEAEEAPSGEDFFVDLSALEQLSDWAVSTLEPPTTEASADRVRIVSEIVARSRELADEGLPPNAVTRTPVVPPAAPLMAPEPDPLTQEVEEWQFEDSNPVRAIASAPPATSDSSAWTGRVAGVGLAVAAGWAIATGVALPITAALLVGALALLIAPGRSH